MKPGKKGAWASLDEKKAAIRATLVELGAAAEAAGLPSIARDVRETRLPKLEEERFTIVVLGEFNHGKSTFINALLGGPVLPTGITPTTALLAHITQGDEVTATLVLDSGARKPIDVKALGAWLTVDGLAREGAAEREKGAKGEGVHHVELTHPAAILGDRVTIVDTPGVNDINEQRAEITYGYLPRADAAVFLLDATQILSASERQFLEERILRSTRERLVFVVAKADLLSESELAETLAFAKKHLGKIVAEPVILPVSAKKALAGGASTNDESGLPAVIEALGATVARERRRLLLDHALADATRLAAFVRQNLAIRRRSFELPQGELEVRIARAKEKLRSGQKVLETASSTIRAETSALKARVRQDLADFTAELRERLPKDIDDPSIDGLDVQRYLSFFVQDTWKAWTEAEGELVAAELDHLAETIIQVTNENIREVAQGVSGELGPSETKVPIVVDTLKYDASVFALGALGTTVFLFVNSMVGGLLALSAPVLAFILKGRVAAEIKAEARAQAPVAIDRVAALVGPKLDELVDGFGARLLEFVAQAGEALGRGISEVLDGALAERRARTSADDAQADVAAVDATLKTVRAIDERIAEIRQRVWQSDDQDDEGDQDEPAGPAPRPGR
ncbi:MAG: Dynamin family protein [Myxococcales bacterium]|nr:Dynamin family protein [Myxococcales bacterium]